MPLFTTSDGSGHFVCDRLYLSCLVFMLILSFGCSFDAGHWMSCLLMSSITCAFCKHHSSLTVWTHQAYLEWFNKLRKCLLIQSDSCGKVRIRHANSRALRCLKIRFSSKFIVIPLIRSENVNYVFVFLMAWDYDKECRRVTGTKVDLFWQLPLPTTLTFWDDKLPEHCSIKKLLAILRFWFTSPSVLVIGWCDSTSIACKNAPKQNVLLWLNIEEMACKMDAKLKLPVRL